MASMQQAQQPMESLDRPAEGGYIGTYAASSLEPVDDNGLPVWRSTMDDDDAASSDTTAERSLGDAGTGNDEFPASEKNVWIHVYDADSVTPWLNWAGVARIAAPIHHAGVEVLCTEWAYQYFDDAWDDPSISGVVSCRPKEMDGYNYQESVCLGPTPLSRSEIKEIVSRLRCEWLSCYYHISRHNCLSFALEFAKLLKTPKPFPEFLLGFGDGQTYMPVTDVLIDVVWGRLKWWNGWTDPAATRLPISNGMDGLRNGSSNAESHSDKEARATAMGCL